MSVIITDFPTRNVNGSAALPSKWSSVHQPIIFKGRRNDQNVQQVQLLNGVYRVLLSGAPPAGLTIGSKAWLVSGGTNSEVTVTAIAANQIAVTGNVAPYSVGGYINYTGLYKNHFIRLRIYAADDANNYTQIGTHELRANPDGTFKFNASGYLKKRVEAGDSFLYNVINKRQLGQGSRFNFSYQELWSGGSTAESGLSSLNQFYWINGIKQLQELYNFNVGAHVIFPTIDTAKFMSDFDKPTYFIGFPFSLSFIWSDRVSGYLLQRVEDKLNGSPTTATNLDHAQKQAVNKMMLSGSYPSDITEIDVWLNNTGLTPIKYVGGDYVGTGYVSPLPPLTPTKK